MNPRTVDAFVLLSGFVGPGPVAFPIPPQSGECVRESRWRFGRCERLAELVQGHPESTRCQFHYCELPNQNSATQEATVEEPAKKTSVNAEAVKQKSTMLTVQLVWAAHAWNATAEEAAKQVVTDLLDHLSRGGNVSVHVASSDGTERTLDVAVESR
jgi:hypothetical protein